ncbi:TetR/AcrR family transcriptional regulator [Hoyosella rhizosphaerae]|uniref:TetR family transcriptional regulator n=1 Tax=Hoyosella rhizosphaerae TaxID=1755582 RepID=A0A916XF32_9ACTN|nr:TetR/AcrR family transcriptional regulator [Hoyosella rhizosphaerae]MBN4925699.1 TetR/AcrR family transcriptional regulator [Hoyosella rhizosphaerae]GGC68626.1 TetR family transcriptional regulator [Hoyosella rhizosphaerae]
MGRPRKFDESTVLRSAMELFWLRGYHAASTEELCAATGLSRSSLYGTFHNKRSLYLRCLREYAGRQWILQQELIDNHTLHAEEKLRVLLISAAQHQFTHPSRRGCLAVDASVEAAGEDNDVAACALRNFENIRQTIEHIVAEGHTSGELPSSLPPSKWALVLTAVLCGNHVLAASEPEIDSILETIETSLNLLVGTAA